MEEGQEGKREEREERRWRAVKGRKESRWSEGEGRKKSMGNKQGALKWRIPLTMNMSREPGDEGGHHPS